MRNPKRTTVTAAALVVGLALVTLVAIFGASLRASVGTALENVKAEVIITAPGYAGFSTEVRDRALQVPGVKEAIGFRWGIAAVQGNEETVNGVTPKGFDRAIDFRFRGAQPTELTRNDVLVSSIMADEYGVKVGGDALIRFPRLGETPLRVAGIYEARRWRTRTAVARWSTAYLAAESDAFCAIGIVDACATTSISGEASRPVADTERTSG